MASWRSKSEDALELPADEFPDEDVELPVALCNALCMAAVSWVLVRSSACWLAMLAKPAASLVMAEPITEINASLLARD